jgi:hypothetical protein
MRRWGLWAAAVVLAAGCNMGNQGGLPQPGDEVRPSITQPIDWKAGEKGSLWVDLKATNASGSRRLGFNASPKNNPVATIQFYDAEGNPMTTQEVELAERC